MEQTSFFIEYDCIGLMFQAQDLYALVAFKRMLSINILFQSACQRAPKIMIYLAPSVLVLIRADPLRGQVGRVGPWKSRLYLSR
jgi:hypothetical protein